MKLKLANVVVMTIAGISMSMASHAANMGKITGINFSGPDDPNHVNVVQIQIDGGFSQAGCDSIFAALRNTEDRQHLLSFILIAYANEQVVNVVLNSEDKYFADRCTISRVSSVY